MVFIPAVNTAQVNLRYTIEGNPAENTLYFQRDQAIDQTSLDLLTLDMAAWYNAYFAPRCKTSVVGSEVYSVDLTTQDGLYSTSNINNGFPGSIISTSSVPASVAPCMSFRTAQRGRSGRGRNYLPSPAGQELTANNFITPTYMSGWLATYQRLVDDPELTYTWVVCSRFFNKAPRATAVLYPITGLMFSDNVVDTQRRRLQ